jgi:3-hydroxyacyl-CoA dehydrogenase
VCGNGEGFIGNFMLDRYGREADLLIEDGASPWQVDAVMRHFGFPMGLFDMRDMAGLDVIWRVRQQRREAERAGRYPLVADKICEAGRFGQKTGAGYYRYEGRVGTPDPFTDDVIGGVAAEKGIERRPVADAEVEERLLYAMVNAGAQLLDNGIAQRASDIDLVMVNGFGFPRHKGGPMFWGEQHGLARIAARLAELADAEGADRWPLSALLQARAAASDTWDTDSTAA